MVQRTRRQPCVPEQRVPLRVSVSRSGARAVLALSGELDVATAPALSAALEPLLDDPVRELVVDLHGLAFADLSGLHVLLDAERVLGPEGGRVVLRAASPLLSRVVKLLCLDQRLRLEPRTR